MGGRQHDTTPGTCATAAVGRAARTGGRASPSRTAARPVPGLHLSRPLAEHAFAIAGGAAGLRVWWQVTRVRCDGWARTTS
ncbi:hypothetical protein ACFWWS_18485 [Streptomyces sp. NPDC059083]|uniref:hypothetical protein n=1 Tax=unclassified Streptomyces TaxID=2593676 RepID=UPI0036A19A8F